MPRLEPLWMHLGEVSERLRGARRLLVASDYDGTLTPIVARPALAGLPPRARAALVRLARMPGVQVAVLSGRRLDDLRKCVRVPGAFLAGSAGFETLDAGRHRVHVPQGHEIPAEVRDALQEWAARFSGAWVEDKLWTLALHFRAVPEERHDTIRAGIRRRLAPFARRVRLVRGKRIVEVQPRVAWDKAAALALLEHDAHATRTCYFGDDEVDEPVLAAVTRAEGVSVAVGRTRSKARYVVRDSDEVVWFLEWLAREWVEMRR